MVPNALAVRARFLRRHPAALAVMGRVGGVINAQGRALPATHPIARYAHAAWGAARRMTAVFGGLLPEVFLDARCPLSPMSATLFRRSTLTQVGLLTERMAPWEDRDYLLRVAARQPIPCLEIPVLRYRVHGDNVSWGLSAPAVRRRRAQLEKSYRALVRPDPARITAAFPCR